MEEIIKKAVQLLHNKFNLPSEGFIAGGSLANTINKLKWGGKCIINDIDIFWVKDIKKWEQDYKIPRSYTTRNLETAYKDDTYDNRIFITKICKGDDYITIKSSTRDGIFNNVIFDTNELNYQMLLDTFDINCTQVGYDLKTNTAYWTKDFEYFYNTKELKVTLPNTPSHTILRILKKRDELDAKLDKKTEFNFLSYVNLKKIKGIKKNWFGDKYLEIYKQYETELSEYFVIQQKDCHLDKNKNFIEPFNPERIAETFTIYKMHPKSWYSNLPNYNYSISDNIAKPLFNIGVKNINDSPYNDYIKDFLRIEEYNYYWRNIRIDENKRMIWRELQQFYKTDDYILGFPLNNTKSYLTEIRLLSKMVEKYPSLLKILENMTLINQITYISDIGKICNESPVLYEVFKWHAKYIEYDSLDDLKSKLQILKIRHRKNIYEDKNELKQERIF